MPANAAAAWEESERQAGAHTGAPTVLPASATVAASSAWVTSFVSAQHQQKSTYGGPAAAATALTNWSIPGVSQATLASELGTDALGFTPPWRIDDALNYQWNRYFGMSGQNIYTTYRGVGNDDLWNHARWRIHDYGDVLIITVYSRKIWYPNAPAAEGHYMVIYGYNDSDGGVPAYLVWDPAGGAHHLAKNDWTRVAYLGDYVVVPTY